jgi:catechol 2,3-dioxygenase-like lactoylglutathione lyase family enzyme
MKRFHAHLAVDDLAISIDFYSKLFGQPPSRREHDYAKWMLEDPRVNFAISARGLAAGVTHFGVQVDTPEELSNLKVLSEAASGGATRTQGKVTCCYARSEKHWAVDPQGLAWEHFMTISDANVSGDDAAVQTPACDTAETELGDSSTSVQSPCCLPQEKLQRRAQCCQ